MAHALSAVGPASRPDSDRRQDAHTAAPAGHRVARHHPRPWMHPRQHTARYGPRCGHAVRRGKLEARAGLAHGVAVWELPPQVTVTLVQKGAGPSPGGAGCNGWGRAGKRQSQADSRPKLEFRGPKLARFPAFFDQKRPKLGVAP